MHTSGLVALSWIFDFRSQRSINRSIIELAGLGNMSITFAVMLSSYLWPETKPSPVSWTPSLTVSPLNWWAPKTRVQSLEFRWGLHAGIPVPAGLPAGLLDPYPQVRVARINTARVRVASDMDARRVRVYPVLPVKKIHKICISYLVAVDESLTRLTYLLK
jgi:hypothetical protein